MRNRRQQATGGQSRPAPSKVNPPIRLRYVLLLAVLVGLGYGLFPRAKAAWQLHDQATALADYGVCMAGPTGPGALLRDWQQFRELLRRRLLMAPAEQAPFAKCATLALQLSASEEIEQAHLRTAGEFQEYGVPGAVEEDTRELVTLEQLEVSAASLVTLYERAWPFERAGFEKLVRPSSHAVEAPHPPEFPRPARGQGLPAYRSLYRTAWQAEGRWLIATGHSTNLAVYESSDGGVYFRAASLNQPQLGSHAGRCTEMGAERSFTFTVEHDSVTVASLVGDEVVTERSVQGVSELLSTSCDSEIALLAVREQQTPRVVVCRHRGGCGLLRTESAWLQGEFDVGQVAGVSVLATAYAGVVRVRSSRDLGKTWTPPTVAFDWESYPTPGEVVVPARLFVLGPRLALAGPTRDGADYPLLFSDDYGASWSGAAIQEPEPVAAGDGLARRP